MESPMTSTVFDGGVSGLRGGGALEASTGCCWGRCSGPDCQPFQGDHCRCWGAGRRPQNGKSQNCAAAGPVSTTEPLQASATSAAHSRVGARSRRKRLAVFIFVPLTASSSAAFFLPRNGNPSIARQKCQLRGPAIPGGRRGGPLLRPQAIEQLGGRKPVRNEAGALLKVAQCRAGLGAKPSVGLADV